jgi:hypothetical protein
MGEKEEEGKRIAWRCSPRTGKDGMRPDSAVTSTAAVLEQVPAVARL